MLNDPVNLADPSGLRVRLNGSVAQQGFILTQLRKFTRGRLSIDSEGFLGRCPSGNDESIETDIDRLIQSEFVYEIFAQTPSTREGVFTPSGGGGGSIYFDPEANSNYTSGFLRVSAHTPASVLAHELLGRAVADLNREPQGRRGSRERNVADRRAVERANRAFIRMGMPPRRGYNTE